MSQSCWISQPNSPILYIHVVGCTSHALSMRVCLLALGQVPVIRCPRGNAAEMIAEKLDKKLRDNIRDTRNSLFNSDNLQAGQFR